jgi:voltage-gated potassium channel
MRIALLAFVGLVAIAITFYIFDQRYTLVDAIYMAVITVSTVGFGEPHPQTPSGRLFSAAFIIASMLLLWWLARSAVALIFEERVFERWATRRRKKMLDNLRDHYIVCGYGRMGREIVAQFRRSKAPLVVIEHAPDALQLLQEEGIPFVAGNATEDEMLKAAGIERARGLVCVASTDEDNLFITLSARVLNPNLFIVVRCAAEGSAIKFERAGANRVVSPYVIGARSVANVLLRPAVVDFLDQVLHSSEMDVDMKSVKVGPGSPLAGVSLGDLQVREQCGASVVAILGPDGVYHTSPSADEVIKQGDELIVMGTPQQLDRLERFFCDLPAK